MMRVIGLLALVAMSGCAAGRFAKLSPGMGSSEVVAVMGNPSQVVEWNERESSWYFGHAHCTLMRDGLVVTKDTARTEVVASTPVGHLRTERQASCAPPGAAAARQRTVSVGTPFGSFVAK